MTSHGQARFTVGHMKIEQSVFDAQERFDDFEQFRYWLKLGGLGDMGLLGEKWSCTDTKEHKL